MVVAEVPLWVVHSNAPGPTQHGVTAQAAVAETSSGNSDASLAQQQQQQQRAFESLTLLNGTLSSGTSSGAAAKAAIYSIDVNGNKFATGGGDGTVRIWNVGALFVKPKSMIQSHFVRKTASSANTVSDNEATLTTLNNYESSGESSMDDVTSATSKSAGPKTTGEPQNGHAVAGLSSSSMSDEQESEKIHDLSSLVRRKKDGNATSNSLNAASATESAPPTTQNVSVLSSKASFHHHHHNKHGPHRLLCTLSAHTGSSVLAVRFSHNGKYLASAGDDAVVCVYTPQQTSNKSNRNDLEKHQHAHIEHWTRIKLCRGHALDAVGLAWAPDDSHLVSCSLDSNTPIIVWKLTDLVLDEEKDQQHQYAMGYDNVLCNPYMILGKGIHTSTVKGVTFDPAGTYLASSGDDPSVCIWRAHDDWGLEKRIDSRSGIFRTWASMSGKENSGTFDSRALSSQSLFRRLSWSTDGAYICSTNSVVKNKHVASTISREGWAVSNAKSTAAGAVNLVGHKQPVVVARHCPNLLSVREGNGDQGEEEEPEYATLLALGDKKGFVTVWSTRKSRPVFKIQCSESRCTVTDLSWGRLSNNEGDVMLIVSLLDGQVVALRFAIPNELGRLLTPAEQARVFQLRYGIDMNAATGGLVSGRKLFVGENSGPNFIENTLQFSMEHRMNEEEGEEDETEDLEGTVDIEEVNDQNPSLQEMTTEEIRAQQLESRTKSGKKRVQPLLMQATAPQPSKRQKVSSTKPKADTMETALDLAEKAATGAEAIVQQRAASQSTASSVPATNGQHQHQQHHPCQSQASSRQPQITQFLSGIQSTPQIPHSTDRIHTVELPGTNKTPTSIETRNVCVADCTNSIQIPQGSSGSALPCSVLTLSKNGQSVWKDQLPGTSCSAIAASKSWLAIGTSDGCVQLYGTSPTIGWSSCSAFRSHPPFVVGRPVVALHMRETLASSSKPNVETELLVVVSDGNFAVYGLEPNVKLHYKGSVMPAMTHMLLSADLETDVYLPKLARIQITESNRLLLLLSLQQAIQGEHGRGSDQSPSLGAGGSLQGFVYDRSSELWMRVSDSRFILSDFYNTLPQIPLNSLKSSITSKQFLPPPAGALSKIDDSVRMGATSSTLKRSHRGRSMQEAFSQTLTTTTSNAESAWINDAASRSHCEDRMACALVLGSASEFQYWFSMYVRTLAMVGNESLLRMTVDMLMGKISCLVEGSHNVGDDLSASNSSCWWLLESPLVLKFDRIKLIRTVVIPEMCKNRSLQRITNEIAIEVNVLTPEQ